MLTIDAGITAAKVIAAKSVLGRIVKFPKQQLCQPSPPGRRRDTVSYQMLGFQFSDKVADIRGKILPGNAELTRKRVDDLAEREVLLEQFPDFQSDGIEGEANPLFDIQKYSAILARGLPHRGRDGESFKIKSGFDVTPRTEPLEFGGRFGIATYASAGAAHGIKMLFVGIPTEVDIPEGLDSGWHEIEH
jgi:hypothetical protein